MRRQIVLTIVLMPVTFGIWYAAGTPFAAPAVWMCDIALSSLYPGVIEQIGLSGVDMIVRTEFGTSTGEILSAHQAGNQIVLEINTRLVSYSIAFYAALIFASNVNHGIYKFCVGLFSLWTIMAFGLASILGKELLLLGGALVSAESLVPPINAVALAYQFNVLLMPTLAPVFLWIWQLQGSPLWIAMAASIKQASKN